MNYKAFQDIQLSRLGMGNMRLPLQEDGKTIDRVKTQEILDYAMANGINYYDTAYVYNAGDSERAVGECMKKHPRDSFYLATKFNYGANPDYKAVFEEQLARLQTDHIDFYLLHCLLDNNIDSYLNCGCIEYFMEQKELGRIKYLGFSSHASVETLEKFASHHQWDFAQLQINYFDWSFSKTQKEYQVLADRNIPVVVMEPVRGGRLASLTPECEAMLKAVHPDWSIASWALRFVETLPQVQVILSGMSNMEQIIDNCKTFSDSVTLSDEDKKLLLEVCDKFHSQLVVPCTACRYCTDGCPASINIPEFMKIYNTYKVEGRGILKRIKEKKVDSTGYPEDCIGCGQCTTHCPQSISIPGIMKNLAEACAK
ncbi:MAG: aldo/keto reductase [Spirochaetales bacterium]|nr:aldo/keto reductase [Candidatus Physcosoma equi]